MRGRRSPGGTLTLDASLSALTSRLKDYPLDHPDIDALFSQFPERNLAVDLYAIIEAFRLEPFLQEELPGLMKQARGILPDLFEDRPGLDALPEKTAYVESFYQHFLGKKTRGAAPKAFTDSLGRLASLARGAGPEESIDILISLYETASGLAGEYEARPPLTFFGKIRPENVSRTLNDLRQAHTRKLEAQVTKLLDLPEPGPRELPVGERAPGERLVEPDKEYLLIKGRLVELDEELKKVIEERGGVPGGVLVKGSEIGGNSPVNLTDLIEEEEAAASGRRDPVRRMGLPAGRLQKRLVQPLRAGHPPGP